MIEIHAYHGWGFGGSFWDNLKSEIPKHVLFKAAERGYFGGEFIPEFNATASVKIIFTHSFGLHWCDPEKINHADYVVAFNAFDDFLPLDFFERRKESKIVKRMSDSLKKDSVSVLKAFYKNCFYPQKENIEVPKWRNESKLLNDLLLLRKAKLKAGFENTELIVVIGKEDRIVPYERSKRFINQNNVHFWQYFEHAGHALPIVNSSDCWSYLCEVLPIFEEHANTDKSQ